MNVQFNEMVENILNDVIKHRRYLHENPELSFQEVNTSDYIVDILTSFKNIEIIRPTKTSVIGIINKDKKNKCIGLRADIDALSINELADVEFKSKIKGVMHACGHDVHTSILLGVADVLSKMTEQIDGCVKLVFQHAEELPPGGAKELVDLGVLDDLDEIYGIHVNPFLPTGMVAFKHGVFSASGDAFDIKIIGRGGHGAMPDSTIDPIVISAQVINSLQTIVSRRVDPLNSPVLTIAHIKGGDAKNVIPGEVLMGGTLRCLDKEVREKSLALLQEITKGICSANGAECEVSIKRGYTVGVNTDKETDLHIAACMNFLDKKKIVNLKQPTTGSEDFSSYLEKIPGNFAFLGIKNDEIDAKYTVHHPKFKVDEDAIKTGILLQLNTIFQSLMQ
jgi:amidohydrolase